MTFRHAIYVLAAYALLYNIAAAWAYRLLSGDTRWSGMRPALNSLGMMFDQKFPPPEASRKAKFLLSAARAMLLLTPFVVTATIAVAMLW